jgi:hypothetical protein
LDHYATAEVHGLPSLLVKLLARIVYSMDVSITSDHVWGVVGGWAVVYQVANPFQTLSMPHTTLTKQWDNNSISIHASCSLDHYVTTEVQGESSWF